MCTVDESDLLSAVEAELKISISYHGQLPCALLLGSLAIRNTLDLNQTGVWVGVAHSTLVRQVTTPIKRKSAQVRHAVLAPVFIRILHLVLHASPDISPLVILDAVNVELLT